jgi:hypothetical protein
LFWEVGYLEVYQTTKATVIISIIEEKKEEIDFKMILIKM